ncbi:hypothetical protein H8957_017738, partial [Semnopithecus entellus]
GCSPGQLPAAWHCHSPGTHKAAAATQDSPTRPKEEGKGTTSTGSVREPWGRAVKNEEGRDRDWGRVGERFQSRAFPALVSPVLREHPRRRPSSSSRLPPARPPFLVAAAGA